uniref:leucine-rich repeat domain-containing protein n=1 Tax=Pedobacter schmidteae TaxID=2201271 RepID=UPI000EB594F5|nr:leucine-rich repeat domain-containing protein [Pedobacter schmidteae]
MNWNNYLLEEKAPKGTYAHLGVLEGMVTAPFNLSELPADTRIVSLGTPAKKFKIQYSNLSSLRGNNNIEAISLNDIDEERLAVFATLPNLKCLQISTNQQSEIPNLSCLKSLEVLVLANLKKVENTDFVKGLNNLKTLYIYGINNLYDLAPISGLTSLEELFIEHGKMSGTGKAVKRIEPLSVLTSLKYLHLSVVFEEKTPDLGALHNLKKLQRLTLLPRYLKSGQLETLKKELPLIMNL